MAVELRKINLTAQKEAGISTLEFSAYGGYTFLMFATPPNYTETGHISVDEVSNGIIVVNISLPTIIVVSPEKTVYATNSVPLNFTVNKPTSWIGYSLDSQHNITVTGNTTISGLACGYHNITVYANDAYSDMASSDIICFTVSLYHLSKPRVLWF